MDLHIINNELDRTERNKLNENFNRIKGSNSYMQRQLDRVVLESGDANPEVIQARANFVNLRERLDVEFDQVTQQLEQKAKESDLQRLKIEKASKAEVRENTNDRKINVSEFDNETKQLLTGGAVAVVGERAISNENLQNESVSLFNLKDVERYKIDNYTLQTRSINIETGVVTSNNTASADFKTFYIKIPKNKIIRIEKFNGNRFRVAVNKTYKNTDAEYTPDEIIKINDNDFIFEFYNEDAVEMLVYVESGTTAVTPLEVTYIDYLKFITPISRDSLEFLGPKKSYPTLTRLSEFDIFPDGTLNYNYTDLDCATYVFLIQPYEKVDIQATGNNTRFRVISTLKKPMFNYERVAYSDTDILVYDDKLNKFTFMNDDSARFVYVYLGELSHEGFVDGVSVEITSYDLLTTQKALPTESCSVRLTEQGVAEIFSTTLSDVLTYYFVAEAGKSYKITTYNNDRFRVVGKSADFWYAPNEVTPVDVVYTLDDKIQTFAFTNDTINSLFMYVYVSQQISDGISRGLEIEEIKYADVDVVNNKLVREFELKIESISNSDIASQGEKPTLCAVKTINNRVSTPEPVGWLYRIGNDFYYSTGIPDDMKKIFTWDSSIAYIGYNTPDYYSPFIMGNGDIVFVFRGDRLSAMTDNEPINPNARQNPIVYPNDDYDNPVIVDLGSNPKPTTWLQNCGADYLYEDDCFIFAEYTRPLHDKCYVWKVEPPFDNPSNWRIVKEFTLSGSMNVGMKHAHTINYDPFNKVTYLTTGDDSSAAAIYVSKDAGENWDIVMDGNEKYCRVLNFIFTKENIYWATDTGKEDMHFFFSASRTNGILNPSSIIEHFEFPYKLAQQATYAVCYIENHNGILILDRYDNVSNSPMSVYYFDIETKKMQTIKTLNTVNNANYYLGFRMEALNWYQSQGIDKRIIVGFGEQNPNYIDALGNTVSGQGAVNNLALSIIKK